MPAQPNAEALKNNNQKEDYQYYRCDEFASLRIVIGDPDPTVGNIAPEYAEFEPFYIQRKGVEGQIKVGYLKTNDGSAIKKCDEMADVISISKTEYEDATKPVHDEAGQQIAGIRAPK